MIQLDAYLCIRQYHFHDPSLTLEFALHKVLDACDRQPAIKYHD